MRLSDIHYLQSAAAESYLALLAANPLTPANHLEVATQLRQEVGPEKAQMLLETTLLRQKAAVKFSRADGMLFTRDGLEQATAEIVANYRAGKFAAAGLTTITDLGCGIGGDALALAGAAVVVGLDRDPALLAMARHNVAVYGHAERFLPVAADLTQLPPIEAGGFFFDPARRTDRSASGRPSRRLRSVHSYRPPLNLIDRWRPLIPHGCVKVSPGIDYAEIPPAARPEFISLQGEVKECALWYGDLASRAARQATLLPGGHTVALAGTGEPDIPVSEPLAYLYEPDGAVIRAHLVKTLAGQLDASLIDPEIAYLTASSNLPTPFATAYGVEAAFPFQLKRLRRYCRENNIGEVVVKKRGSPLDPDDLRRALRLKGTRARVVFLTRVRDVPTAIVAVGPLGPLGS